MLTEIVIPSALSFFTALITWFFARRGNNADVKSAEIDNEIKSVNFYEKLLDNLSTRLDTAIKVIEERDEIIRGRDKRIDELLSDLEYLTAELKKYKQLNGKSK